MFAHLAAALAPLRRDLTQHAVYATLDTRPALRRFMASHVFAVWDFMTLVKTLQRRLTCVDTPWLPVAHAEPARLINEIVLGEETDEVEPGRYASHFEIYCTAMREVGASTAAIERLIATLRRDGSLDDGLVEAPPGAATFVRSTFATSALETHEVAAAFVFGREQLVPQMFERALAVIGDAAPQFRWYLARHVEVDGADHGPKAERLLVALCADDERRWSGARRAATDALVARRALWDSLVGAVELRSHG